MNFQGSALGYAHSWALAVGIDFYQSPVVPPLATGVSGADAFARTLQEEYGFETVIRLLDNGATAKEVRRTLAQFMNDVKADDCVIVYFGGQGYVYETAMGPVGAIIVVDSEGGRIDTVIAMDELSRIVCRLPAKHVMLFMDTNASGHALIPRFDSQVAQNIHVDRSNIETLIGQMKVSPTTGQQLSRFLSRPERLVLTASSQYPEEVVLDTSGPGGLSPFTGFLVKGLMGGAPAPGGVLRAQNLASYIQEQVMQLTSSRQTPQFSPLLSTGGDLVFRVQPKRQVFISYRRADTAGYAGRAYDRLVARFGKDDVFMDIGGIEPGSDFADEIRKTVAGCAVLLALIGPSWLATRDEQGNRRLENPDDFVRLEIQTALQRNVLVIPILIENAPMPPSAALPADLSDLSRRNAMRLSHENFDDGINAIVAAIEKELEM